MDIIFALLVAAINSALAAWNLHIYFIGDGSPVNLGVGIFWIICGVMSSVQIVLADR